MQLVRETKPLGQKVDLCRNGNNAAKDRLSIAEAAWGGIIMGILLDKELTFKTKCGMW